MKAKEFRRRIDETVENLTIHVNNTCIYSGVCLALSEAFGRRVYVLELFEDLMYPPRGNRLFDKSYWLGKRSKRNVTFRETALRIFEEEMIRTGKHRSL